MCFRNLVFFDCDSTNVTFAFGFSICIGMPGIPSVGDIDEDGEADELYDEAVLFVSQSRRASISAVQRRLRVGYNRAARIIETMEEAGVVSPMATNGNREVLVPPPPED